MTLRFSTAAIIFTTALHADQVILKNGDRLSGAIVKKDATKLTIKSIHFGTITLPWDEIDSLKSDQPVTVVLLNKTTQGTLSITGRKAHLGPVSMNTKDIVGVRDADGQKAYFRLLRPKLTKVWGMTGNIGFAGASGNARTHTITVPLHFVRATNNDKITASFNLIRSSATSLTASAVRGGWAYNRNLAPMFFVSTVNNYEYDRFQNLDLRSIVGGGLGAHAWKAESGFIDFTAGGDYNHEAFVTNTRSLGELYWGDNLAWKPSKQLSFTQSYRMFNDLTNSGEFRQNADFAMSVTVFQTFHLERVNQRPLPHQPSNRLQAQ